MNYNVKSNSGWTGRPEVVQSDGLVISSHTSHDTAGALCKRLNNGAAFNGFFPSFWGHTGPVVLP